MQERSSIPLQHITLHGHEVGYRMAGEGEAIVLIHGMAGSSKTWKDVMPALAERYTVLAPDLLGHGESAKPMGDYSLGSHAVGVRDLMGALGITSANIVGQSLGGGVAMQLAYQHPEVAERLVLIGSGGLGREVNPVLRLFTLPGTQFLMPLIFPRWAVRGGDSAAIKLKKAGWHNPHVAEMWRAYRALTEPENRTAFVKTLRAVIDAGGQSVSAMDRLYLTEALPTMVMWGDKDPIIPVDHAYAAHEAMPGSRLEVFPNVGHFPHVEVPEQVVAHLLDFFETTEAHKNNLGAFRDILVRHTA